MNVGWVEAGNPTPDYVTLPLTHPTNNCVSLLSNPFAIIVMAHLKTKATTGKLPEREQWKWRLIRGLYEKEFEREQIIKLFEIIDNMMTLSPELQSSLESKIKQFEEERTMPLMRNRELRGRKIGEELGELRGIERG
ncbi:MAG: hypothetical protein ACKOQ2_31155, partial [Dolichospermum sp.]